LWTSAQFRCELTEFGDPPFLFVQLVGDGDRTLYSPRVTDPAHATDVATDLWRTFVKDPH